MKLFLFLQLNFIRQKKLTYVRQKNTIKNICYMSETRTPNPSSDNFWFSASKYVATSIKKQQTDPLSEFLSPIDESPEFYDPYSDLNLFLSQKIKQELQHCGSSKKWSLKIQEELISKIAPEFQKKFPPLSIESVGFEEKLGKDRLSILNRSKIKKRRSTKMGS